MNNNNQKKRVLICEFTHENPSRKRRRTTVGSELALVQDMYSHASAIVGGSRASNSSIKGRSFALYLKLLVGVVILYFVASWNRFL